MNIPKKQLSRRSFLKAGGASALTALLAACGRGAPTEPPVAPTAASDTGSQTAALDLGGRKPSAPPETTEIICGPSNPNYATQAIYWIAQELGYFEEEGFKKVEIITANENFAGVVGGSLTFADVDSSDVFISAMENVPVTMLGTWRDREWQILGLSPTVKTPEDLKGGKMIIGTPGTREYGMRVDAIKRWSKGTVDPETEMEPISISGASDAYNQALLADQVKLALQFPRHVKSIRQAGGDIILSGWLEIPQEGLIANDSFIEKNPQTVVNFLRATLKARAVWLNHDRKDEILAMMKKNNFTITPDFEEAYFVEPEQYALNGGFRMQAMYNYLKQLSDLDIVPATMKYQDFTNLDFLHQAQKELYGTQWPPPEDKSLLSLY